MFISFANDHHFIDYIFNPFSPFQMFFYCAQLKVWIRILFKTMKTKTCNLAKPKWHLSPEMQKQNDEQFGCLIFILNRKTDNIALGILLIIFNANNNNANPSFECKCHVSMLSENLLFCVPCVNLFEENHLWQAPI